MRLGVRGVAAVFAALVLAAAQPAGAGVEVYRPRHRRAEELLPIVETLLGGAGRVALDRGTNALVIAAEEPTLRETLGVLEQQDRALRSVVLHWSSRAERELESEGVRIAWSVEAGGDLRIGNVRRPRGGSGVAIAPEALRARGTESRSGTLRVLEGERARLETGTTVPVTERRATGWRVEERTTWVAADSGIEFEPRLLPDGRVRLALLPFEARLGGRVREGPIVASSGAETLVTVSPGETVAIGGIAQDATTRARDVFSGTGRERRREERLLLVRVEVE